MMNTQKTQKEFPTLEKFSSDVTKNQIQEKLEELFLKKDGVLVALLLAAVSSLVKIISRWGVFRELAIDRLYDTARWEWKETQPKKKYRVDDFYKLISNSDAGKVEEKDNSELLKDFKPFEGLLPEFVMDGVDEAVAFRAHMCGAGKKVRELLSDKSYGDVDTRAYLTRCNEAISKVITASEQFAREVYEVEAKTWQVPSHFFPKVGKMILNSLEFRELFDYKDGKKFTDLQVCELVEDWGLKKDSKISEEKSLKNNSSPSSPSSSSKKKARIAVLAIRLKDVGVDEEQSKKMAKSVERIAREKGLSDDEAFTAKAVNTFFQGACDTAIIYANACGLSFEKLNHLVKEKKEEQKRLSEDQSAKALQKQKKYKRDASHLKHKNKKSGKEAQNKKRREDEISSPF